MRSPDGALVSALINDLPDGTSPVDVEVGGTVFSVSLTPNFVQVIGPLEEDGQRRFRLMASAARDSAVSEFLIGRTLENQNPHFEQAPKEALLCSAPAGKWGFADSGEIGEVAGYPTVHRLTERALAAVTLAAPRLFEARRAAAWASSLDGPDASGEERRLARGRSETLAYLEQDTVTRGADGETSGEAPVLMADGYLAPVLAAAGWITPPKTAAALPDYKIGKDCAKEPGGIRVGGDLDRGRTVAADGVAPVRAAGTAPDPGAPSGVGRYLVYNLGSRVRLSLQPPAGTAGPVVDAVLWVGQRTHNWRSGNPYYTYCYLLFGGRSVRFTETAQIADPGLRALAGLLLRAREIALADIAASPSPAALEAATAAESEYQAAERRAVEHQAADRLDATVAAAVAAAEQSAAESGRGPGTGLGDDGAFTYSAAISVSSAIVAAVTAVMAPAVLPMALGCAAGSAGLAVARAAAIRWKGRARGRGGEQPAAQPEDDPRAALLGALLRARGRIPAGTSERLLRVQARIEAVLARAAAAPVGDADAYVVREAALRYIPDAIERYLALPADAPKTAAGLTPAQELDSQIEIIDARVQQVLDASARELVGDLEAHGRFLQDRLSLTAGAPVIPKAAAEPEAATAAVEPKRVLAHAR
jgi:hypothetical protein